MPNSNCIIINDVINIEIPTIHISKKQAEKLKSREMKEGWWRMMKDEWRMMKDDDFKLLRGFDDGQTHGQHLWM